MGNYYVEANNRLKECYKEWFEELVHDEGFFLGDDYSNPYYCAVPVNWYEYANRVLIVGEEGHGNWGCGKWGNKIFT